MIGIDIVDLSRIDPADQAFLRHVLTEEEQKRYIYYWEKLNEKRPTSTYYMGRLGRV